jgi:serine/threonine protein kinase
MVVLSAGELIGGRYALEQVIGRGGMGEVWRARDRELHNLCAVKFLLPHLASDKETRTRFLRESRALAQLRSPHAVQVLGAGEHNGALYLAMELLEGESLHARLRQGGPLDRETTFALIEQVARALSRAHRAGIVHRDLKPDNIWIWAERDLFVKVLDFGVAKARLELGSVRTTTGTLLGTPHYMSPEQANGERELDHRADLWSLGIITIECLTGRRPYESAGLGNLLVKIVSTPAPDLAEFAPELGAGLAEWWKKALAHEPAERFQSAEELVETLRPHLLGQPPRPWPSEPVPPPVAAVSSELPPSETSSVDPLMTTHSPRSSFLRRQRFGVIAVLALSAAVAALWLRGTSRIDASRVVPIEAPAVAAAAPAAALPPPEPLLTPPETSMRAAEASRDVPSERTHSVTTPPRAPSPTKAAVRAAPSASAVPVVPTPNAASAAAAGAAGSQNLPAPAEADLGRRLGF